MCSFPSLESGVSTAFLPLSPHSPSYWECLLEKKEKKKKKEPTPAFCYFSSLSENENISYWSGLMNSSRKFIKGRLDKGPTARRQLSSQYRYWALLSPQGGRMNTSQWPSLEWQDQARQRLVKRTAGIFFARPEAPPPPSRALMYSCSRRNNRLEFCRFCVRFSFFFLL